jgi:hypothetical protein
MPIATPQGTLDFKSVDKVTFVGASSNTVIDTTTGSLGVGVGVNGPTSNLHVVGNTRLEGDINMLHTSNTASIKLNSNVVTEFPRSKKLIKYPRVALTGSTSGGYTVETSNEKSGFNAWEAFDNDADGSTANHRWRTADNRYTNNSSTGTPSSPTAAASTYLFTGSEAGDWISVEFPEKMKLVYFTITGIHYHTPYEGVIYGYNTSTSTWERVTSFINKTGNDGTNNPVYSPSFYVDEDTNYYSKYAMIVVKTNGHPAPSLYEWKLYGVPEYDPDADGVDVKVTSYPNVPNTDWLELYYDAKDLADGAVTSVSDLKPSSLGTALNSSSTNNITVSDNAFVFNGTDSYIKIDDLTNPSGAWTHSVVAWINSSDLGNFDLTWIGDAEATAARQSFSFHTSGQALTMGISGSNVQFRFVSPLVKDKWHHVVYTFNGGAAGSGSTAYKVFVDGVEGYKTGGVGGGTLTLPAQTALWIGSNSGGAFKGKIANFRIFNRVLSNDEIYQLYAYQKEYFGHGDLGMTLKAGRLGIGTSEPRAMLDVRGRITREYNPGEIIETIQGKANGRYVKVQSGTYLLQNVGTYQDLTSTHTRITGSNFEYTPPPGTTRVIYEFWCFMRQGDPRPILHFQGRVDGTIVNDSRHTYRDTSMTTDHDPQKWIYNHMCVSIGEVASDNIAGGQVATWNSPRSIDFTAREYSDSYEGRLHNTNHWDGSGSDILVRPTIKITAIA